jgi:hypothetical protein
VHIVIESGQHEIISPVRPLPDTYSDITSSLDGNAKSSLGILPAHSDIEEVRNTCVGTDELELLMLEDQHILERVSSSESIQVH